MGRLQTHSTGAMLDGARAVVLERGGPAATITAIAAASRSPAGSIYHRFGSRDALMAELWMRAVGRSQRRFLTAVASRKDPLSAAVAGGLSVLDFATRERDDARLLVSLRREDLLRSPLPPELVARLRELNRPVEAAVAGLAKGLYGSARTACRQRVALAVVDIPYGAVRRYLIATASPPNSLRAPVERAIRAALQTDAVGQS